MDRTALLGLTRRALTLAQDKMTDLAPGGIVEQPAAAYTDPDRLARDRELFRRTPQLVGYRSELPVPQSYVTKTVMGVPMVLTRLEDGSVAAFRNVCAHRQARVVTGCGIARRFACPYHAWTYDLAGRLAHVPMGQAFPGAPLGMTALPAADHAGFLWVSLEPGGEIDIASYLGELSGELASWGIGDWTPVGEKVLDVGINWKLAVDTFAENYHFATVHRNTFAEVALSNVAAFDTVGPHARLVFPLKAITALAGTKEDSWEPMNNLVVIYHLHPGIVISVTVNNGELFRIYPGAEPGRSVTFHQNASPLDLSDEQTRASVDAIFEWTHATVRDEDYPLAETLQDNLTSGVEPVLRFGANEPCLQHRHRVWETAIAGRSEPVSARSRS